MSVTHLIMSKRPVLDFLRYDVQCYPKSYLYINIISYFDDMMCVTHSREGWSNISPFAPAFFDSGSLRPGWTYSPQPLRSLRLFFFCLAIVATVELIIRSMSLLLLRFRRPLCQLLVQDSSFLKCWDLLANDGRIGMIVYHPYASILIS